MQRDKTLQKRLLILVAVCKIKKSTKIITIKKNKNKKIKNK
jgi:hypothetical protein